MSQITRRTGRACRCFLSPFVVILVVIVVPHQMMSLAVGDETADAKRVLLLYQGPDGHPPQTHEYEAGMQTLAETLQGVPGLEVTLARADADWPEGPELIRKSDAVVLFVSQGAKWIHENPRRLEAFGQLAGRGGGFSAIHWAMGTKDARYINGFLELFGGCHGGPDRKYQVVDTVLQPASSEHVILQMVEPLEVHDEFYYELKFIDGNHRVEPLMQVEIDGELHTVAWAWQRGDGGRSFGFSGLHFHDNWKHPVYRRLIKQGVLWTCKLPVTNPADGNREQGAAEVE